MNKQTILNYISNVYHRKGGALPMVTVTKIKKTYLIHIPHLVYMDEICNLFMGLNFNVITPNVPDTIIISKNKGMRNEYIWQLLRQHKIQEEIRLNDTAKYAALVCMTVTCMNIMQLMDGGKVPVSAYNSDYSITMEFDSVVDCNEFITRLKSEDSTINLESEGKLNINIDNNILKLTVF